MKSLAYALAAFSVTCGVAATESTLSKDDARATMLLSREWRSDGTSALGDNSRLTFLFNHTGELVANNADVVSICAFRWASDGKALFLELEGDCTVATGVVKLRIMSLTSSRLVVSGVRGAGEYRYAATVGRF
jgi:hypothetical protein